jgi:hypothetical protein
MGLAFLFGAARIVLVGYDMREVDGRRHFFGSHPRPLRDGGSFEKWLAGLTTQRRPCRRVSGLRMPRREARSRRSRRWICVRSVDASIREAQ